MSSAKDLILAILSSIGSAKGFGSAKESLGTFAALPPIYDKPGSKDGIVNPFVFEEGFEKHDLLGFLRHEYVYLRLYVLKKMDDLMSEAHLEDVRYRMGVLYLRVLKP